VLSLLIRFAGWQRLFARDGRPDGPTCLGAGSAAAISSNFPPAKLDYALKVWLVHRLSGRRLSLKAGTVSICMLGLVDAAALLPPALAGALMASTPQIQVPLLAVAAVGLASTALILSAPRLHRLLPSGRLQRFSGKVAGQRTSWREQLTAYLLLSASLWTRVAALIVLLLALHLGLSLGGALVFICLTAGSAFVPIPSFSLGAGTVALSTLGLGVATAARFALAVSLITLLAALTLTVGVAVFYAARRLRGRRLVYA
jgi:MFS family permease